METTGEVQEQVRRVRLELVTRKFMVTMLALTACWVGIAVILTGAPNFIEQWFSPWSRYAVGGVAFISGLTTVIAGIGSERSRCAWWIEVLGLAWMALWYAGLGIAYVGLVISQGGFDVVGPGEPLSPQSTGRGYVPLVYLGLMVMTATPLVTMVRLGRPGPRGPQQDEA